MTYIKLRDANGCMMGAYLRVQNCRCQVFQLPKIGGWQAASEVVTKQRAENGSCLQNGRKFFLTMVIVNQYK